MKKVLALSLVALSLAANADMRSDKDGCHIMTPVGEMHFKNCKSSVWRNPDDTLSGSFEYTQDYIDLPFTKSVKMTGEESDSICALGDLNGNTHTTKTWTGVYKVNDRGDGNYLTPSTVQYLVTCKGAKQI